jgi:predicted Zn-dependent protease with MMP-like domain
VDFETLTEPEWQQVDRIRELLDEQSVETARREIDAMLRSRPGHPDLRVVAAEVALAEDDPRAALEALHGAERSADPVEFFNLRAQASYHLCRFEEARDDAERAESIDPEFAGIHDLLSRIHAHLGNEDASTEHALAAAELDLEAFPLPLTMSDEEFDTIVQKSLEELPGDVRQKLEEIPVMIEALPDPQVLAGSDPPLSPDILGLFVGASLLERSHSDLPAMPPSIHIFRLNLLRECPGEEELAQEIRTTVQHEVGHLMGGDEGRLEDWGIG